MTALGGITTYTALNDCILCLQGYSSAAGISFQSNGTHIYTIKLNNNVVDTDTWTGGSITMGGGKMIIPELSIFMDSGDILTITATFTGTYNDGTVHSVTNMNSLNSGTVTLIEL